MFSSKRVIWSLCFKKIMKKVADRNRPVKEILDDVVWYEMRFRVLQKYFGPSMARIFYFSERPKPKPEPELYRFGLDSIITKKGIILKFM